MANFHHQINSGKKGSAVRHAAYITRQGTFSNREDLIYSEYGNLPAWAQNNPNRFWQASDRFERMNGAVYREHVIALPQELEHEQQVELAKKLVGKLVSTKPYHLAVHASVSSLAGAENAHLHLMYSDRIDDGIDRSAEMTFKRYNSQHPDQGGRKKDSGGKNRMQVRDDVIAKRKLVAETINTELAQHGHNARVDHRTLREQGIERKAERYLGQACVRRMTKENKTQYLANRYQAKRLSGEITA